MLQLLANQMIHILLPSENDRSYSEHVPHTYTLTNNNKHQCWKDPILAAVSIKYMLYIVNDLNGLDAYILCTVHEQDLVVVRYKRINYMSTIQHVV